MTSRRGAVKVNPVTGKMEKADPLPEGKHRDGCMLVDDRYVNAAKDLGMGAEKGACGFAQGAGAAERGRGRRSLLGQRFAALTFLPSLLVPRHVRAHQGPC